MSTSRNRQTKRIVKPARKMREEVSGDAENGIDRVRHRGGDRVRPVLHVLGGAAVAQEVELVGGAQIVDERRQVLEEVAHAADERHEQQEREHGDRHRRAEHGDRRGQTTGEPGLRHDEAHGELEDERQEDPDEDDQERVRDRHERPHDRKRRCYEQDRPQRQDKGNPRGAAAWHPSARSLELAPEGLLSV